MILLRPPCLLTLSQFFGALTSPSCLASLRAGAVAAAAAAVVVAASAAVVVAAFAAAAAVLFHFELVLLLLTRPQQVFLNW